MINHALQLDQFGDPTEVLRARRIPIERPGPGQVLLRMLRAPIHPSDLGSIGGTYGELPPLPAIPGREGVAEVLALGPGVGRLAVGQRVLPPEGSGCWRSLLVAEADKATPVPAQVPLDQAAMASINPPTAWLLLKIFVQLQPGDWIIQNAANSAVGHSVIQLCRHWGLRSLNVVRDSRWIDRLRAVGADVVLTEGPEVVRQVRDLTAGSPPRLGLNSVGGSSAASLIKTLGPSGTLVTFGGMTGERIRFPTRYLIFNDVHLVGFWLQNWRKSHSATDNRDLMAQIFALLVAGTLRSPVEATYPLDEFAAALAHAAQPHREGKILFGF
jgi:NADPH:quinone reductase-like Zn-dependent oxidoreductase